MSEIAVCYAIRIIDPVKLEYCICNLRIGNGGRSRLLGEIQYHSHFLYAPRWFPTHTLWRWVETSNTMHFPSWVDPHLKPKHIPTISNYCFYSVPQFLPASMSCQSQMIKIISNNSTVNELQISYIFC